MSEIILVISVLCQTNITNVSMPKEEKISCINFYANCLVGPNGSYLSKERKNCEARYKINKANNGGTND